MKHYIDKAAVVAEIARRKEKYITERLKAETINGKNILGARIAMLEEVLVLINTLEAKDADNFLTPFISFKDMVNIQYSSINDGIKAHAETYSFNLESELFNQLTPEQQKLWRKEIEQACISGGEMGVELARDLRYKENLEVKEVDLDFQTFAKEMDAIFALPSSETKNTEEEPLNWEYAIAKHFYSLGLKAQKGE